MSIYLDLTREFNRGRVRAIIASGQAVVLHRMAVMSKDGDWILREDDEALAHVLGVLERHGARYRYGAPLARPWLAGGWSAHLQFQAGRIRVRTDFFTRPPRLTAERLARAWSEASGDVPVVGLRDLADLKMTDRERDWPIIGEIARRMTDPRDRILYSRSALDLMTLAEQFPDLVASLAAERPLLAHVAAGRDRLEAELDAERRAGMRANEARLARYALAARAWAEAWPDLEDAVRGLPLAAAHARLVERATRLLPTCPEGLAP